MAARPTRRQAVQCVSLMRQAGFTPRTIINCGVGSTPELVVWRSHLPTSYFVGIDSRKDRGNRWPGVGFQGQYIKAFLGATDGQAIEYCSVQRSLRCNIWPACHGRHFKAVTTTLDALCATHHWQPPFLVWMDIEGSELAALEGAANVLAQTAWLNIECRGFEWDTGYSDKLHESLQHRGFELVPSKAFTQDVIYRQVSCSK